MSPQLTLQTPLKLPPEEISSYLEQLWSNDQPGNIGSNTFCLLVWQPSWIEQELVRTGSITGPILGTQRKEVLEAAREVVVEGDLPHSTPPLDESVHAFLASKEGNHEGEDFRGQHVHSAISNLQPRRLITLAPTLKGDHPLETLVAAYCPLPEEGGGQNVCGDVVVLRGNVGSLKQGLGIVKSLVPEDLPSWVWWNGSLDDAIDLLDHLALPPRRLIIDSAIGDPSLCLDLLLKKIKTEQAVNDLNWLRLRDWRETLAMVFDPPDRREALRNVVQLDIDIEGSHPVQGLLLAAWIADRLSWNFEASRRLKGGQLSAEFSRPDGGKVDFHLIPLPVGRPSIHPGQIVGIRLISKVELDQQKGVCVILGSESGECRRLEAGGMASMDLIEELVPDKANTVEMDVARLLSTSRGSTSPLLQAAAPIAVMLLS